MRKLHDGTEVSLDTPTKMKNGKRYLLTDVEKAEAKERDKQFKAEQAELAKTQYQRDRKEEYPDIGDQLDVIWKEINEQRLNGKNLTQDADDMLGKILAVKKKHPKPETKK